MRVPAKCLIAARNPAVSRMSARLVRASDYSGLHRAFYKPFTGRPSSVYHRFSICVGFSMPLTAIAAAANWKKGGRTMKALIIALAFSVVLPVSVLRTRRAAIFESDRASSGRQFRLAGMARGL